MTSSSLWPGLALAGCALAGCTAGPSLPSVMNVTPTPRPEMMAKVDTGHKLDGMIAQYAAAYEVPVKLVHRVVKRESNYNAKAYHSGNYGLMQIRYRTAKGMGYDGSPSGLLDPETNLKYAVKYLRGAYVVAEGNADKADWLYRTGYYYDAKRKGLLVAAGLKPAADADAAPVQQAVAQSVQDKAEQLAMAAPASPETTASTTPQPASARFGGATSAPASTPQIAGATSPNDGKLPGVSMAYAGSTPGAAVLPASAPIPGFRPQ